MGRGRDGLIGLDVSTLVVTTALNLFMVAAALPLIMGKHISPAARHAQQSLLAQAAGWACIILSGMLLDLPLSVLAMVFGSLAQFLMFRALQGWLGPRPLERLLAIACVAMPLGYALAFEDYALRVGWANAWLALQLFIVANAALWTSRERGQRWRYLLAGCYAVFGVFTLGRGVLGAFFTSQYPSFLFAHPLNTMAQLVANVTLVLVTVAVLVAWRRESEVRLENLANTDPLTNLLNRRGWKTAAQPVLSHARRHAWPVALLMIDLDHFKLVNDRHGHQMGDRALALMGRSMRACLRESDLAGRLGGEEFVLLLPHTQQADAQVLDSRLRAHFTESSRLQLGMELNFSSGLAFCDLAYPDPLQTAMTRADQAMYQAKAQGRGHLQCHPQAPTSR